MTGWVELDVFESSPNPDPWPAQVTRVLVAVLDSIGGLKPKAALINQLAVGDRQFLLRCLGEVLVGNTVWHSHECRTCGQRLSIPLLYSNLPVKTAAPSYPFAVVRTSLRAEPVRFRVPTGEDQQAIASCPEGMPARRMLVSRLVDEPIDTPALLD